MWIQRYEEYREIMAEFLEMNSYEILDEFINFIYDGSTLTIYTVCQKVGQSAYKLPQEASKLSVKYWWNGPQTAKF